VFFTTQLFSQRGEYFIHNYLPKDYNAGPNINGITQDKEGRIFVACGGGVLTFDGLNWFTITLPQQITAYSIISDDDGTIYVGAEDGEFFMMEKDKRGSFKPVVLKANLKTTDQPHEPIKQILRHNGNLYFLSADKLIEKKGNSYKAFSPQNAFNIRALPIGKHLFVTDLDYNLMVLDNGVLQYVANSENLISKKAFFCYKLNAATYAVGYRGDGMYKVTYDSVSPTKTKFEKWPCAIDNELIESEFNNGCQLRDGNFIITTNKKGAYMINKNLEMVKRFNTKSGIYEDNVKAGFQDVNGNLWLSTYYGASFIELNSKLFKYDRQNGITGLVTGACYYNNSLYVSTDKGVQYINEKESAFRMLQDFTKQSWGLSKINNELFISTEKGLFIYDGKTISQKSEKKTFCILCDPYKPELIYAGTDEGVDVFSYIEGKLTYIKTYQLNIPVKSLASDYNKNIYFGCESNGIFYLNYYNSFLLDSIQKREGLPEQFGENYVFSYDNKLLIGTDSGIYTVRREKTDRFFCEKSKTFYPLTKGTEIFRGAELVGDVICSQSFENKKLNKIENKVIYISNNNGQCFINNEITNKLKDTKVNLITYDSENKTTFICTDEGLFIVNKQNEKVKREFSFFFNWVVAKKDTIIANYYFKEGLKEKDFEIEFENNQLTFCAGYNCYENKNSVEFSYYIEGSEDENYGIWSTQNIIKTSNLHEGDYIFHIKARCDLNKNILEIHFPFKILPPWYRTIWAYLIYVVLFILFIVIVVKLNSKRLVEQNLKLEGIIKQRTYTIEEQVKLLEHQKQEITDSINYAQRIQSSILPTVAEIKNAYKNVFVFFQPKDIVSGDFYWFHKINNDEFLIACADCTGHGVPGAFMSTICAEKLTESALRDNSPAKVLFNANNAIKKVLKQETIEEGTNKDGMEIALIKYNSKTKHLTYTGANRPLWIVKGDTKELIEIKPTKASIASFTPLNFEYEQNEIDLNANDVVYLTSDGFPDQFGGRDGKKFMSKNMKQFLKEIMHLPVDEQQKLVSEKINNWKGNYEQVDDLLVIGVRV
jgi:serine phosphatase RsbU (regulator of sigma subunit)/ligand-binding sensor domain-containing protein